MNKGANTKQSKSLPINYMVLTPLILAIFFFWNDVKLLYQWSQGEITGTELMQLLTIKVAWDSYAIYVWWALGVTLLYVIGRITVHYLHHRLAIKQLQIRQVKLPNTVTANSKQVNEFVKDLHKRNRVWYQRLIRGREWFGMLTYVNDESKIEFFMLFPEDKRSGVEGVIQDHFPGCELVKVAMEDLPLPAGNQHLYGGSFRMNKRGQQAGLPLYQYDESQLGSILTHMRPRTWIYLRFSPENSRALEKRAQLGLKNLGMSKQELETIFKMEIDQPHKTTSELTPTERARYTSLYKMYTGREKAFQTSLSIWSEHQFADSVVQDTKASIERAMEFDNYVYMKKTYLLKRWHCPLIPLNPIPWPWQKMHWSHAELANVLHFPDGEDKIYQVPETGARPWIVSIEDEKDEITEGDFGEGMYVGNLVDERGNVGPEFRIPYETWTYMSFGAGETGSGKTSLILNLIYKHLDDTWYNDLDAPGITFIDPKGVDSLKLAAKINADLKRMEAEGKDISDLKRRVHFFNLSSDQYVLGLNLLHKNEGQSNDDVVDKALDVLKNAYKRESMQLDKFGQLALHALLLDGGQHSILGMEQMLRKDGTFRNRILPKVKGTIYEQDWKEYKKDIEKGQDTKPVLNRMQKIRLNTRMRRLFGQSKMGLHPAKWMDDGHIVIFSCDGLTPTERQMVMGFIITQYHIQARLRKRMGKIHLNICDEFHAVQIPVVKAINSLDRARGHCFVPMTQYAQQVDEEIQDAFDGNVGTYFACAQGAKSAKAFHEMSRSAIDADEIKQLKKLYAVISTKNKDGERVTAKVKIPPPLLFFENGKPTYFGPDKGRQDKEEAIAFAAALRFAEELMARDCDKAEDVDQWINQYLNAKTVLQEVREKESEQKQNEVTDDIHQEELTPSEEASSSEREDSSTSDEHEDDFDLPLY
jgi:heme exporter protein D